MEFDLDFALHIARHLQRQDLVRAIIDPDAIPTQSNNDEPWKPGERLEAHLLLMQDAGWLDSVDIFTAGGTWQARLTYQGHLWLEASSNESVMKRIKQEVQNHGLRATNTVIGEVIKGIVSAATT